MGNGRISYEQAQVNQAEYLLDEIKCGPNYRLLDIGCGNGRILEAAKNRGATALGITISPEQVRKNNTRGLPTVLMNYKDIPSEWNGRFDGIIANGSIEHFAQLEDALAGRQDKIYSEMFEIMHRVLKPGGRVATTVIHFRFPIDPTETVKGTRTFKRGSLYFHSAQLARDFGGWHPKENQLIDCAEPYFRHIRREDGTRDYHLTSEYWIRAIKKTLFWHPGCCLNVLGRLLAHPIHTLRFIDDLLIAQSWATQFRDWHGQGTPTQLFRDTWKKR